MGWFNKNGVKTGRVLGVGGGLLKKQKSARGFPPKKVSHVMYDCVIVLKIVYHLLCTVMIP